MGIVSWVAGLDQLSIGVPCGVSDDGHQNDQAEVEAQKAQNGQPDDQGCPDEQGKRIECQGSHAGNH
jgi:hypothetical protein